VLTRLRDLFVRCAEALRNTQRFPEPYFAQLRTDIERMQKALDVATSRPSRFFAQLQSATVECPTCGTVARLHAPKTAARKTDRVWKLKDAGGWNARTQVLCCRHCRRLWTFGLVAYPVGKQVIHHDQVPNDAQRGQLRELARGWTIADRKRKRHESVNVVMPEGCTCAPVDEVWRAEGVGVAEECPVHRGKGRESP
jgi:hypothetical protein